MSTLRWLPEALQDIERLHAFVAERSPEAARRLAAALLKGAELLQAHPHMGRPHGGDRTASGFLPPPGPRNSGDKLSGDYREWLVRFSTSHYVLRYRVVGEGDVVVVRVWHERERR